MTTEQNTPSPNIHISEFLDYYCKLKSPDYAVMLSGKWGSGKTWFIEQEMERLERSNREFIYVSLYGMTKCDQIQTEFFKQLHPVLSSKGVLFAGKLAKGLLRGALKIDLDGDGKPDGSAKLEIPELKLPDYLQNTEDKILIFDDIERCAIPVEKTLGFINSFVEHEGYRVIIIANEEELRAKDTTYLKTKEKVIGKTFEISPELKNAYESFVASMSSANLITFNNKHSELILKVYDTAQYRNLRHLRQCLQDLDRIFDRFSEDIVNHERLMTEFIVHFLIYSFEIKSGAISEVELTSHDQNVVSTELNKQLAKKYGHEKHLPNIFDQLQKKYFDVEFQPFFLSHENWVNLLCYCQIDIEQIETELKYTSIWKADNKPDWVKLWYTYELTDDEFEELSQSVYKKFKDLHYKKSGQILHLTGMFLNFTKQGIFEEDPKSVISTARAILDKLAADNKLELLAEQPVRHLLTGWEGKGFQSRDDADFVDFANYLFEQEAFVRGETVDQVCEELIDLIDQSGRSAYDRLASRQLHLGVPFLHKIDQEQFVQAYLDNIHTSGYWVSEGIKARYEISNVTPKLAEEFPWLRGVIDSLNGEVTKREGKLSAMTLKEFLKDYWEPALKYCEEYGQNERL